MPITDGNGETIAPLGGWRILSNSTARKTINLDAAPRAVRKISIEDTVGDASSNNITVNANGDELIDGSSSLTISTDYQRVVLESTGTGWTVVSIAVSGLNSDDTLNLTADTLEIRNAFSLPTVDGTAGQVLTTDGAGNLSWKNDATGSGAGGDATLVQTLNTITGATGDVTHNCTNSHVFYHSSIAGNFTPNLTELTISNGETTEAVLVLDQGGTGYIPEALRVNGTGSTIHWEGEAVPTASTNNVDMVEMRIMKQSNAFTTLAKYTKHSYEVSAASNLSSLNIPTGSLLLFLDAGDSDSYPGSGTTWYDLSGNDNDATAVGTPTFGSSRFAFNDSDHFTLPEGFGDFSNGITIFAVVDMGGVDYWERIIDFSNGADVDNVLFGRNGNTTNLSFDMRDTTSGDVQYTATGAITNSTMGTYAVTADGSNIKIFADAAVESNTTSTVLPANVSSRDTNYIGKSPWGDDSTFKGELAVVIVYNRALSTSEIEEIHNTYADTYGYSEV